MDSTVSDDERDAQRVPCVRCGKRGPWTVQPCWYCRTKHRIFRQDLDMRDKRIAMAEDVGRRAAAGDIEAASDEDFDL